VIQEDILIADESQFFRIKKKLSRNNPFPGAAGETKIGIGVESTLSVVRSDFESILIPFRIVNGGKIIADPN
jgi:hypothetical protein